MKWQYKAKIQNFVNLCPSSVSYDIYYWLQRKFGSLRDNKLSPISRLQAGLEFCQRIEQLGYSPIGKTFMEIGTGRRINTPLAFWLLGAEKIITVDLNPYLKEELVKADMVFIQKNTSIIQNLFDNKMLVDRFNSLLDFIKDKYTLEQLLNFINVEYIAPGDARNLDLAPHSIDYHTSYTVLEHIPAEVITAIINEGNRLVKPEGLFIHKIDYSDHFSHSDKSISAINFLQFSDDQWDKIAGNRYMYMNRLRHDDFLSLLSNVGHRVLLEEPSIDQNLLKHLSDMKLDFKFVSKPKHIINTTGAWIISKYNS
ncbi:MAG: hypothetical protein Kow0091_18690 [Geminocystis sp.]